MKTGSDQYQGLTKFRFGAIAVGCYALTLSSSPALQIDFETAAAGSAGTFAAVLPGTPNLVIPVGGLAVTFAGGELLNQVTGFPANHSGVYGTTSMVGGMNNPLRILFSQPVINFTMTVYNGQTWSTLYQASDTQGNLQSFNLDPSIFSGSAQASFAGATSVIEVSDFSGWGSWDFFIDNLSFELAPGTAANTPDGGVTVALLLLSVGLLAGGHERLSKPNRSVSP